MNPRTSTSPGRLALAVLFLFVFVLAGCRKSPTLTPAPAAVAPRGTPAAQSGGLTTQPEPTTPPISATLSEGQPHPTAAATVAPAGVQPLSDAETQALLSRLPSLPAPETESEEFKLPDEPIPPPRTGDTVEVAFPAPVEAPPPVDTAAGPLQVLRFAPEGEVPLAPQISVTFDQPMVPIATLQELSALDAPVQIEPALPGTWRWLGTKTLTFQYDSAEIDRLPMATEYVVRVPAGTTSAVGGVLETEVTWRFSTPPPLVEQAHPGASPQPLEPLFFVSFNQRIDPAAVLDVTQVLAGRNRLPVVLATSQDIAADLQVSSLVKNSLDDRWLAFKTQQPLPKDTTISITIGPGIPSAEGSLTSPEPYRYSFRTYTPLGIIDYFCGWKGGNCPPGTPFSINFNNPLDASAFSEEQVTIQPELPNATISVSGSTLMIQGATSGRTRYTVEVQPALKDVFGQTLAEPVRLIFSVGSAEPHLYGNTRTLATLDPAASAPIFTIYAVNIARLDVQVYAVQPADWLDFKSYLEGTQQGDLSSKPPGRLLVSQSMPLEGVPDALATLDLDLSPYLDGDYGHFIVIARPPNIQERDFWQYVHTWVQVTDIGLDALTDQDEMTAWATDLLSGAPLAGLEISSQAGPLGVTDEDGVASFDLPVGASYIVAAQGADQAILPQSTYAWKDEGWRKQLQIDQIAYYVFDDRGIYRPGESVHVKGWLRRIGAGPQGDVGLVGAAVESIGYTITDGQGNQFAVGNAPVNAVGGFDFVIEIPQSVNLGYASVTLTAQGSLKNLVWPDGYHSFQVLEFRRPEFEVMARNETPGPYFAGDSATLAVQAKYYAGDPLPDAVVYWSVVFSPSSYNPPNWPEFTFGSWEPWWWQWDEYGGGMGSGGNEWKEFYGTTNQNGEHFLQLDFSAGAVEPVSVQAEASVTDINNQVWTGKTNLLVHPADLYVGLRSSQYFVALDEPLVVDLIVTDLDGSPVADRPISVTASRMVWKFANGMWQEEAADTQQCTAGSQAEPVTCQFETPQGGSYRITGRVTDSQGRSNESTFTRWVSGASQPMNRQVAPEQLNLIPDKESYQPGDTAKILVQAPWSPAEGLLTVARSGFLYTERFTIEGSSTTLEIPIEAAHIPNLVVQVDLVGQAPRLDSAGQLLEGLPPRPAYASDELVLSIPPYQRTLAVEAVAQPAELEPGGQTTIDVLVKDAAGLPVEGAELAVWVVDEAILALSNYQVRDPLSEFYRQRSAEVTTLYGRATLVLSDPSLLDADFGRGGGGGGDGEGQTSMVVEEAMMTPSPSEAPASASPDAINVRSDFNPLAAFEPQALTDASGKAQVQVNLPDNLTRYRIMVVAVDASGQQFGTGESNLTARLPLMVRPSAPRFLNFGDVFELPVIVQNQTGADMLVDVALQASNLTLGSPQGVRVSVPAHNRVEVRFPASAEQAGTAVIQVAAASADYADAAVIRLPVYTPATTEAFATYGVVDEGAVVQPLAAVQGVFPQFGGLEIQTSSTAVQALTDAVLYLVEYPYECSEQIASRILAVAGLRDVLSAFQAEGLPPPAVLEASVQRDIKRLEALMDYNGGVPYWRTGQEAVPFNSIHVAYALSRAREKGYAVPDQMWNNSLSYLQNVESYYPQWYDQDTRWTLSAYALFVRDQMGDPDPSKSVRLVNQAGLDNLSLDAVGWVWPVLLDTPGTDQLLDDIRTLVNNAAIETAGAANFVTDIDEQSYLLLESDRRTDAILLDAMIRDDPQADLIPKLVNGLLAHRQQGRWNSTQENTFVLQALDRYFNTFEAQEPDFVARLWLGDEYAGEHIYRGRTTERQETNVPMSYLVENLPEAVTIDKLGEGRLYYRLGLKYAPTDLKMPALDNGFVVSRVYEAVDDPTDVTRDSDGVWHIKAGSRVRVRLTMVADSRRYHVALVDPLPAGLEMLNPGLAVSASIPQDPNSEQARYGWWWSAAWYDHQNLRDERAEAFTPLLWEGVYQYTYIARATVPGTFVVPPSKAEEMYFPEVFGRSAGDVVVVK